MENIFATAILNRIRSCIDRVIEQQQGGFRPHKSTRDVVFGLWRDMERRWRSKEGFVEGFVVTFIDFSKAFDSLVWEALRMIMECLVCPAKLVAVVRLLYSQSPFICSKEGHQTRFWFISFCLCSCGPSHFEVIFRHIFQLLTAATPDMLKPAYF